MSLDTLTVDDYQLTTLVAHADAGRAEAAVAMAFFFRKLPKNRNYVLFCGLRQILEHAAGGRTQAGDHLRSRFVLRPNPFAQIYSRPPTPSRAPGVCYLESRRAAVVGARLARSLAPKMEEGWEPATIALWRRLDPATREFVADTSRRILETLAPRRRRKARI